jgi:hypothetical protein
MRPDARPDPGGGSANFPRSGRGGAQRDLRRLILDQRDDRGRSAEALEDLRIHFAGAAEQIVAEIFSRHRHEVVTRRQCNREPVPRRVQRVVDLAALPKRRIDRL